MTLPEYSAEVAKARDILMDTLRNPWIPQHLAVSIWCAADSFARALARCRCEKLREQMRAENHPEAGH